MRNDRSGWTARTALGTVAALALVVAPVQGQDTDGRWLPFVGCWEAVGAEEEIGLLCFSPATGGVDLTNYVDGEVASTERLVADGSPRPIAAEGCEGWEAVEFSEDGRRAFTRTEFTCAQGAARTGTGVMALTAPTFWVDVRELDVEGETVAWVQEYVLADADRLAEAGVADPAADMRMAVRSARMVAAAPIDLEDVEEATEQMGDRAVETWIVAQRDGFDVDADDLVRLDDAGVSDRVIDAVVAVSHPDRFMVDAGADIEELEGAPRPTHYRGYMGFNPWFGSAWGFGYGYGPYGYSPFYRSRFSPGYGYGYGFGGYGYGYWGSRPGVVIIERRDRGGRIYNGSGYRSRDATPSGRTARTRGGNTTPSFSTGGRRGGAVAPSRGGTSRRGTPRGARRRGGSSGGGSAAPSRGSSSRGSVAPSRGSTSRRGTPRGAKRRSGGGNF